MKKTKLRNNIMDLAVEAHHVHIKKESEDEPLPEALPVQTANECGRREYCAPKNETEEGKVINDGISGDKQSIQSSIDIKADVNPYVQIAASKHEVMRRIKAFQQMKRNEIDVVNVREFCQQHRDSEEGCARTRTVVLKEKGTSSHLKQTKVDNQWGPQLPATSHGHPDDPGIKKDLLNKATGTFVDALQKPLPHNESIPDGVRERLIEMEGYLSIDSPVDPDIYKRLKLLEDRLLYLESVAPEYLQYSTQVHKQHKTNFLNKFSSKVKNEDKFAMEDDLSLDEIDQRMFELKKKLKRKQLALG